MWMHNEDFWHFETEGGGLKYGLGCHNFKAPSADAKVGSGGSFSTLTMMLYARLFAPKSWDGSF
jgi:hypothetical protein